MFPGYDMIAALSECNRKKAELSSKDKKKTIAFKRKKSSKISSPFQLLVIKTW